MATSFLPLVLVACLLSMPSVSSASYEDISVLIEQKKGKAARDMIDRESESAGENPAVRFKLAVLRAESFIADDVLSSSLPESFAAAKKWFGKLSQEDKPAGQEVLDKLKGRLSTMASEHFLKALSFENKDKNYLAYEEHKKTREHLKDFLDDRNILAADMVEGRIFSAIGASERAIKILEKADKKIPDLIKKYRATIKQDAHLQKSIHQTYISLILAHLRVGEVQKANEVRRRLFAMIDPKSQETMNTWFLAEVDKLRSWAKLSPVLTPLLKKVVAAFSEEDIPALQSMMNPASPLFASIPSLFKKEEYVITYWKLLELTGDTEPKAGSRATAKILVMKNIGSQEKKDVSNLMEHEWMREENHDMVFHTGGIEKVIFRFDGREWKIEQFDFHIQQYYP